MTPTNRPITIVLLTLALLACNGADDDTGDEKTPATCPGICAQQNRLCGTKTDCVALCAKVDEILTKTDCAGPAQEGYVCLFDKNVCDRDETACPSTALNACIDTFCAANPSDPICTS
jgi:hypothetical protein